jgi:hypothetical protein
MGWNDHVDFRDMECADCGEAGTWEFWDDTALARYSGGLDKVLGHDAAHHARCPYCGSTHGESVDEDDAY